MKFWSVRGAAMLVAATLMIPFGLAQEPAPQPAPEAPPVVAATPAPATTMKTTPAPAPFTSSRGSTGMWQLAGYFGLLLALLGGGLFVMRNGVNFLRPQPKGPRKLEISETRMLGNRQFLVVATYESRKMLIGVCPGRINYLCTLDGPEPEFPRVEEGEEAS